MGIVAERAIGGALVVDEATVHLTGFSDPRAGRGDRGGERVYANYHQRRDSLRRRHGRVD